MHVAEIKTKEDFANALKNEKFKATVVDFTATWCKLIKNVIYD